MIIINRKKLILIFSCIMILSIALIHNKDNLRNEKSILTISTPVSGHCVILDAGHGQPDRTEQSIKTVYQKKK